MDVWTELVEGLMAYGAEEEWFEFKENWFEPMVLGEYISVLSNAAAMAGRCGLAPGPARARGYAAVVARLRGLVGLGRVAGLPSGAAAA